MPFLVVEFWETPACEELQTSNARKMYFLGVDAFYEADLSPLMHINVMQAGVYKVHRVMYMSGRPHGSKPL